MQKNKLLFVIPSLKVGGMERVMSEIVNFASQKESLEIHLVLYGIKRDVFYSLNPNIVIHRPAFKFDNRYRLFYTIKTLFYLRKTILKLNAVSILSFGEYWNNLVLLSLLGKTPKIFVSDRCNPEKKLGFIHDFLRKMLYPNASGIIVQTDYAKDVYSKSLKFKKLEVISNPIRTFSEFNLGKRENIILTVGRFIESKNIDLIIQIFGELKPVGWKLVIVGDDDLKQSHSIKYKKMIADFGMEKQIEMLGFQNDIESLYLKSKIFAFASESEGFPNVVGEALMAGLPTLVFDKIPSIDVLIPEDLKDFIIPFKNEVLFKAKLNELILKQGEVCDRRILTKHVKDHFASSVVCEQYLNCLLN